MAVCVVGRHQARRSFDALALSLFPSHVRLEVTPGNARVQVGSTLTVTARLVGNDAPVVAQLLRAETPDSEAWHPQEMTSGASGFTMSLPGLTQSFRYRVVVAGVTSETYEVAVLQPPHVTRIDLDYTYPKALALAPRSETDTGDIYAPAGTEVRVQVHTDAPVINGALTMTNAEDIHLAQDATGQLLTGTLSVTADSSYRVALADRDGMTNRGDTEYFIRILNDRPPDVHIVKPASDRRVTLLEEVDIQAEANDDFGIASLELVYSVAGGKETVVPLRIPSHATNVSGSHTLYLEDLDVRPGDFISYYVRARDLAHGKQSSEARSDLFFLEVKPFEEAFSLAQSQAASAGGASNPQFDDLVNAQKKVIVATWKLDRRAQTAGSQSADDVKAVSTAEAELRQRVEQTASAFGTARMRTPPRSTFPGRGGPGPQPPGPPPPPGAPRAGQTLEEENVLDTAAKAMGDAVAHLNALRTTDAVGPEMEALNQLIRAQGDVRKREIQQQRTAANSGNDHRNQDLSSVFDKELARQQQTNYETANRASRDEQAQTENAISKIEELARRQDDLAGRQQALANDRSASPETRARELQKLIREQNDLRQQAEQLAQEMARQQGQSSENPSGQQQSGQQQAGQQSGQQSGQQQGGQQQGGQRASAQGQSGQSASSQGQSGQSGQPRPSQSGQQGRSGQQQSAQSGAGQSGTESGAQPGAQSGGQSAGPGAGQSAGQNAGQNTNQNAGQDSAQASAESRQLRQISEEMRNAAGELGKSNAEEASARSARAADALRQLQHQLEGSTTDGQRRALGDLQLEAQQLADAQRRIAAESAKVPSGDAGQDVNRRLAGEQERLADRLDRVQQGLEQQAKTRGQGATSGKGSDPSQQMRQAAGDSAQEITRQRLGERMQQTADAFTAAAQNGTSQGNSPGGRGAPEDIARALDRIADRLSSARQNQDDASRTLSEDLARVRELRDRVDQLSKTLEQLNQPGASQDNSQRELREARDLLDELQRGNQTLTEAGVGQTFAGQGMVLSAPGTEGFKQDFARWQELSRHYTEVLDRAETSIAGKLREKDTKERLAAGVDDKAPAQYQQHVESYFRALATRKTP
jgi:DNA repair exonuclease SbcCD ATPase subunit